MVIFLRRSSAVHDHFVLVDRFAYFARDGDSALIFGKIFPHTWGMVRLHDVPWQTLRLFIIVLLLFHCDVCFSNSVSLNESFERGFLV